MADVRSPARCAPPLGLAALTLGVLLTLAGCVPIKGVASMTLLTRELPATSGELEMLTEEPVEMTDTMVWCAILLVFGEEPTHESVMQRMLEKYDADVIVDAELESFQVGVPYIYLEIGTRVRGRPARFVNGGSE